MRNLCIIIFSLATLSLWGQNTFTEAYLRFRPYHYQVPAAWNRIRCEVATHGQMKWATMETEYRQLPLVAGWRGIIPAPVPDNTYFFKQVEDMGKIFSLILTPNAYGYAVYPFTLEDQFKLSESELLAPRILSKGFMNTIVTDLPYDTEAKLDSIVYLPDNTRTDTSTSPQVYDEYQVMNWLGEAEYYNLYNVKNFYCYFDNRPDSIRQHINHVIEVTAYNDAEVDSLMHRMEKSDLSYAMIPYWMTDLYLQLPVATSSHIARYGYLGYIINPLNGTAELMNSWGMSNMMDFLPYKDIPYDLVAYCGDEVSIRHFLENKDAQRRFIYNVLNYPDGILNRIGTCHKPSGLNLYLPISYFNEKRALVQFIKSLSLVMDSLNVGDSIHAYRDMDLSLTFPTEAARYSDFISGLECFVDKVYYADFDSLGLALKVNLNNRTDDNGSLFMRIVNAFYLFHLPYKIIRHGVNDGDVRQLMLCDYNAAMWGLFFFIDFVLLLALIAMLVLRISSVEYNLFITNYPILHILLNIFLIVEFFVFLFFMLEAVSPQVIFFHIDTGSLACLALIALPVLPILIYLLIDKLKRKYPIP